ncbi:MAG TPA: hypothetical protein VM939_02675 [Gemmatimonadaceae bacterium]|nr:hypothetical protein [Gemmatimonadaceae bacterium]
MLRVPAAFAQGSIGTEAHDHTSAKKGAGNDSTVASLLNTARSASEIFKERSAAISAGYRRVGMDFPSMGEHWVNPLLVFEGKFDVRRPAILTYSMIQGRPVLLGVVFAIPLNPGEEPPAAFGSRAMWHEHNGPLEVESLLPEHHSAPSAATGIRLAVLHAWVRTPNPDGVFAAENWALPFIRAGLDVPSDFPRGAARAVSLLTNGERYFIELGGQSSSAAVTAALERCGRVVKAIIERVTQRGGRTLTAEEVNELDGAWHATLLEVEKNADGETAKRINGGSIAAMR